MHASNEKYMWTCYQEMKIFKFYSLQNKTFSKTLSNLSFYLQNNNIYFYERGKMP